MISRSAKRFQIPLFNGRPFSDAKTIHGLFWEWAFLNLETVARSLLTAWLKGEVVTKFSE